MDLMTDLQIIQDLLDASSRRGVAVYAVLEVSGVPYFLDMCSRLQVNAAHLRVRKAVGGLGGRGKRGQRSGRTRAIDRSSVRAQSEALTRMRLY